ncbi:uncharacterized protein LOC141907673 [Tubulanus polymorphus]|uniref:uncharacterized protein LOC141907673 n=1 Tax=Tubulanus polymorphus TaxID=672921 RepID=UPI003DA5B8CA
MLRIRTLQQLFLACYLFAWCLVCSRGLSKVCGGFYRTCDGCTNQFLTGISSSIELSSTPNTPEVDCLWNCLKETQCRSVNYMQDTQVCKLNKFQNNDTGTRLTTKPGWIYLHMVPRPPLDQF